MTRRSAQLIGVVAGAIMAAVPLSAFAEGQPPPGEQLQYLIDRIAVEDTMAKYAKVVDYGTPEEYAALFTEDGLVRSQGHDYVGREAIQKMITPVLGKPKPGQPKPPRLRHILSNDSTRSTAIPPMSSDHGRRSPMSAIEARRSAASATTTTPWSRSTANGCSPSISCMSISPHRGRTSSERNQAGTSSGPTGESTSMMRSAGILSRRAASRIGSGLGAS